MSSTLAVVVSFHPETTIVKNIEALLQQATHVIIVDNETSEKSKKNLSVLQREQVSFIFNEENKGVAKGFNQGMRWGIEKNYDYFLLMDQDSCPMPDMVNRLLEVLRPYVDSNKIVLAGPHHEDFERKTMTVKPKAVEVVPLLISSGSLISKKLIDAVGLYDERLFIDHVDHDYCLRLAKKGGLCLKVNSAVLLHKFGEAQIMTFLGKSFFLQDYSPFRRYHMMRNRIILYKRYGMFKGSWFWMDLRSAVKDLVKLIFFEEKKIPKLKALFRGFRDGLLWKD